ncbi:MAG: ion transporter [Bacteroidota bacterium]
MLSRLFLSEQKVMIAILLNTVIIFMLYFPEFYHNRYLVIIDNLFIVFFLVEAIVKITVYKPKAYFSSGWNRFDFAVVVFSLPSVLVHFIPIPDTSVLIILRLFRLIRLIRFIRFIPNLNQVLEGLGRALKASVFVLLALLVFNLLLALFTCHFYAQIAPEYFGNPFVASYSIFQMFTVEGWNEIPAVIATRTDNPLVIGVTRFYFVVVVLIGGIFGMSLANAVFVDEMTIDNNRELEEKIDHLNEQIAELKEMLKKEN